MSQRIEDIEFTIFDTETTGLDPSAGERIVEIAGIRVKGSRTLATFNSLVNSGKPVSEAAFAVNKITPEMLREAPPPQKVLPAFLEFSSSSCLCCYNAEFDLSFLNSELKMIGLPDIKDVPVFDILTMARKLLPGLERYALWFVANTLGFKESQEHRALSDAGLTLNVFDKLKRMLMDKGISDFAIFAQLFAFNLSLAESSLEQKLSRIQEVIDLKAGLRIKYLSSRNAQVSEREVIPKEIRRDARYKYLIAYCCLKKEERTFRVDNILNLEMV